MKANPILLEVFKNRFISIAEELGVTLMRTGEVTETLQVIYYPFTFAVAFGCAALGLTLLTELVNTISPPKDGQQ